jgi:hypothetical protein
MFIIACTMEGFQSVCMSSGSCQSGIGFFQGIFKREREKKERKRDREIVERCKSEKKKVEKRLDEIRNK